MSVTILLQRVLILIFLPPSFSLPINISNIVPRYDLAGTLMDVHDGNIIQWNKGPGNPYYWYGVGYGMCNDSKWGCEGEFDVGDCGFQLSHSINLYVSYDLVHWKLVGDVLPRGQRPEGIYYRPKTIYNKKTGKYILWVNIVRRNWLGPNFGDADYVVAVADVPEGPFTVVNPAVRTLLHANPGDFALLVDDDGSAYVAYDAFNNFHIVTIEKLTDDYLNTLGSNATSGPISGYNNEAPIFFKRNGWYYLLFGQCCCFCRTGSNSQLFVSTSPLGPFTDTGADIDPYSGPFFTGHSITHGQESFVIEVPLASPTNETAWIFVADRWGSALDGHMGHDLQFWEPLKFVDTNPSLPSIKTLVWIDQFSIDVAI